MIDGFHIERTAVNGGGGGHGLSIHAYPTADTHTPAHLHLPTLPLPTLYRYRYQHHPVSIHPFTSKVFSVLVSIPITGLFLRRARQDI